MVDINKVPKAIGASYAVWTPDTEIVLTNVPWDNNYRDIVKFKDRAELNKFIDDQETMNTSIEHAQYAPIDQPIRLRLPISEAYGYNYIRVYNPAMPSVNSAPTYYYYFITGVAFLNPGVTVFNVEIDIWQTFGDKISIGSSFVEKGHIGVANSRQMQNYGRDYLTLPEGLDTGSDAQIVKWSAYELLGINNCNIMVVSNIDLTQDPGDDDNPNLYTSPGGRVQGVPTGTTAYFFEDGTQFINFVSAYSPYPWIMQGIMQITAIPKVIGTGYAMTSVSFPKAPGVKAFTMGMQSYGRSISQTLADNWRDKVMDEMPERFRHLKKFLTFPYLAVELTTMTGTPVVLKPEQWRSEDAEILVYNSVVSPGQRSVIAPRHYNGKSGGRQEEQANADGTKNYLHDDGEWLQHSTMVGDFPQFAIVNNAGVLALASSAHGRAQQYRANDWSQQKSLRGNDVSYDQASAGIANTQTQGNISRWQGRQSADIANDQAILGAISSGGQGMAMGAASGGLPGLGMGAAGAVSGAVGAGLGIHGRNRQLGVDQSASQASQAANTGTAAYVRDTNKSLADWGARGDYEQSIAAIQAKVQDTAMTPPFTAGQAGGEVFNFVFGGVRVYMHIRQLPAAEMNAVGEIWLRYGYAVRRFIKPPKSLMVMSNFTYWKFLETYVESGRVPEGIKQALRGMFEKGVTVWSDPKKIGRIDWADNEPLEGIYY